MRGQAGAPLAALWLAALAPEVLDEVLSGYRRPNDKVSEWTRGLRTSTACLPLLANHLYGPSYVSLDFALALHGLIPEGVAEVTCVTLKPARRISNGLWRFSYHPLPFRYYGIGQQLGVDVAGLSFLIASPTKALCDRLVHSRQLPVLSRTAMRQLMQEIALAGLVRRRFSQGQHDDCSAGHHWDDDSQDQV